MANKLKLILTTGTNGARAVGGRSIDHYMGETYFDMLAVQQSGSKYTPRLNLPFKVDTNTKRLPIVEHYQLVVPILDRDRGPIVDKDNAPSWAKAFENPGKAVGFLRSCFGALFNGEGACEYMALENVLGRAPTGVMIWFPEGGRVENLNKIAKMLEGWIPEWKVIALHGGETSNRAAEEMVKREQALALRKGLKGVVVVSMKMGARSFSVGEIDTIILAYDRGSAAGTAQKSARGLTRGHPDKKCAVLSLSLDPTREDVLDAPILEAAAKIAEREQVDIVEALRRVFRSLNVFTMDPVLGDPVRLEVDEYAAKVLQSRSLAKVVAKTADVSTMLDDPVGIANVLQFANLAKHVGAADHIHTMGRKFVDKNTRRANSEDKGESRGEVKLLQQLEAAIKALADCIPVIVGWTHEVTVEDALEYLAASPDRVRAFENTFGVGPAFVLTLCERRIINVRLLNLMLVVGRKEEQAARDQFWS